AAARVTVMPDGRLNLSSLVRPAPAGAVEKKPAEASATSTAKTPSPPVAIDVIRLVKNAVAFADQSIQPTVKTGLTDLSGTIKGLSSKEIERADVALTGKVDGRGPLNIKGKINPLTEDAFTDLTVRFDNVDLTPASPYTGKYAGYPIA